ncbi:hypothetical protein CTAYLR_007131 [Chrysophaeum taylorii]|uniref:SCP domain-containing protein n=1 Tax=Chrysophaeum taylorii TaxID=2483200 RepID=A0AAD7U824_9STRA|nr:hypothetical protein CTAYLR_007131 [Chrysophaeum taylorii]
MWLSRVQSLAPAPPETPGNDDDFEEDGSSNDDAYSRLDKHDSPAAVEATPARASLEVYYEEGKQAPQGKLMFPDGSRYDGGFENGKMHGAGTLFFASSDVYEGEWREGKFHGFGKLTYANGDSYDGEWSEGRKNGHGVFAGTNDARYEGDWVDDAISGQGTIRYPDGRTYTGGFENFDKSGHGRCQYANGAIYEGEWLRNKRHGKGLVVYASGAQYDGMWDEGKYEGTGTYVYTCGDLYEGGFHDSRKHGIGKYTWNANGRGRAGTPAKSEPASVPPPSEATSPTAAAATLEPAPLEASSRGNSEGVATPTQHRAPATPTTASRSASPPPSTPASVASSAKAPSTIDSERMRLFKKAELIRNNRAAQLDAQAAKSKDAAHRELFHRAAEVVGEGTTKDMTSFEDKVVDEHNFARTKPAKYAAERVRPLLAKARGRSLVIGGKEMPTKEGLFAVNDLLATLANSPPCAALELNYAISRAATEHARDLSERGVLDAVGFDGANLATRMKRHGKCSACAEAFGTMLESPADIVLAMLIDDGKYDRRNRKTILNPNFTTVGCSPLTPHPKYDTCIVVDYAAGFEQLKV